MRKTVILSAALLMAAVGAQAKSWKIGPSSVTGMDFLSINGAMNSAQVTSGDTLYLDQYYNESAEQTVTKRVVIIGTGYDTSLTDEQVVATLTNVLNLKANNVEVKSVKLSTVYFYNEECTLDRCYASSVQTKSTTAGMNHVYSCYIQGTVTGYSDSNYSMIDMQNCMLYYWNSHIISRFTSSKFKYNTVISTDAYYSNYYCLASISNSEIANNIILDVNSSYPDCDLRDEVINSGSGNSIEHNVLSRTSALPYFPTNKIGFGGSSSELFTQQGNYSDFYKLAEKSAAKGYATDGGEVGCHGGMFGCPSGGRPQYIPYFSKVVVGSRTEDGKLPVSVTIKIQDE